MDQADREFGRHNAVIELRRIVLYMATASVSLSKLMMIADYKLDRNELTQVRNADDTLEAAMRMVEQIDLTMAPECQPEDDGPEEINDHDVPH